jgi:hypothetical protein
MLSQVQRRSRRLTSLALFALLMMLAPMPAFGQGGEPPPLVADTFTRVVFDPTTYAPALVAYDATLRDWNSSQVFFQKGFLEHNERYTISGRPNDVPMSYGAGRSRILTDALINLQMSIANNAADQVFERILVDKFPEHRKLVRTLGWIERSVFASWLACSLAARHYEQAADNQANAQRLGLNRR